MSPAGVASVSLTCSAPQGEYVHGARGAVAGALSTGVPKARGWPMHLTMACHSPRLVPHRSNSPWSPRPLFLKET